MRVEISDYARALAVCVALLALAVVSACAKQRPAESGTSVANGSERGDCYGNGTCNEGLICLSNLCVRPPPADCAKVAKKVGGFTFSNYMPRAERAAAQAKLEAECRGKHLTREAGDCILRATSRSAAAKCPTPIGLDKCDRLIAQVEKVLASSPNDLEQFLARGVGKVREKCENDGVTESQERCVFAATSLNDLQKCDR